MLGPADVSAASFASMSSTGAGTSPEKGIEQPPPLHKGSTLEVALDVMSCHGPQAPISADMHSALAETEATGGNQSYEEPTEGEGSGMQGGCEQEQGARDLSGSEDSGQRYRGALRHFQAAGDQQDREPRDPSGSEACPQRYTGALRHPEAGDQQDRERRDPTGSEACPQRYTGALRHPEAAGDQQDREPRS